MNEVLNVEKPKPNRKQSNKLDHSDEETPGCLGLLKKISCTLQCGGSTCSIKETEQLSSSSPSVSSCESEKKPDKPKPRPRKRKVSKPPLEPQQSVQDSVVVPAPQKRVRRTSKKNVPEAS